MEALYNQQCVPCRGGVPPLTTDEIEALKPQVPDWQVVEREGISRLERSYPFKDFSRALAFTNRVGELAEDEDHHPAILTEWGKVTLTWWTHKIKGLHANDFIMAAKSDQAYQQAQSSA
jgi:4a-hydroxytetrahydrobiopterin dehydratase